MKEGGKNKNGMKDLKQLTKQNHTNQSEKRQEEQTVRFVVSFLIIILPELLSFPAQPHSRHHIP